MGSGRALLSGLAVVVLVSGCSTERNVTSAGSGAVVDSTDATSETGLPDSTAPAGTDGQLRAVADDSAPTCLLDAVSGSSPIARSSDAARVLVDPSTSATSKGTRPTGFDPFNTSVSLSAPTGTATIGIDPATHHLIRHGSDGAITDISFLTTTDEAAYHPGGKRIVAVGTDQTGAYVTSPSVRIPRGDYVDVPDVIIQQACD